MKQIRQGIFETNSSSIHAVCISKRQIESLKNGGSIKEFGFPIYQKTPLKFELDYFGRGFGILTSPQEKASYLISAIYDYYKEGEERNRQIDFLRKTLDEYKIKYETSIRPTSDSFYDIYGVDLDEYFMDFLEDILTNKEKLITYLFGDSFVITGGDEEDYYYDFVRKINTNPESYDEYSDDLQEDFKDYEVFEATS